MSVFAAPVRAPGLAVAVALAMLAAAPLCAQTPRPGRPYRGLFGGGVANAQQALTVNVDFGSGYDDNLLVGEQPGAEDGASPTGLRQGQTSGFNYGAASLAYRFADSRLTVEGTARSAGVYYPVLRSPLTWRHGASAGASIRLWRGATLVGRHLTTQQPYYTIFPSLTGPSYSSPLYGTSGVLQGTVLEETAVASLQQDESLDARLENHTTLRTSVGLEQKLSRRVDMSASYLDERSWSLSRQYDLATRGASGRVGVELAKGLGLRLGYGYAESAYQSLDDPRTFRRENVEAGLNFNRALSLTRRTTLSFNTGSTTLVENDRSRFYFIGNADVRREIGRTWNARVGYRRDVHFLETFREPVASDAFNLRVDGLLNRRLQFQSAAGVSKGAVGLTARVNDFTSYYGSAGVNVGLTRTFGVGVDYSYVQYQFDNAIGLPAVLLRRAERQRVVVSGRVWAPLFVRRGRVDATR